MITDTTDFVLEHLRLIRSEIADVKKTQDAILLRLSNLENTDKPDHSASHFDFIEIYLRIVRIENRLGITEE